MNCVGNQDATPSRKPSQCTHAHTGRSNSQDVVLAELLGTSLLYRVTKPTQGKLKAINTRTGGCQCPFVLSNHLTVPQEAIKLTKSHLPQKQSCVHFSVTCLNVCLGQADIVTHMDFVTSVGEAEIIKIEGVLCFTKKKIYTHT